MSYEITVFARLNYDFDIHQHSMQTETLILIEISEFCWNGQLAVVVSLSHHLRIGPDKNLKSWLRIMLD